MSDDGYTLAEMLAALIMVALAVGGIGLATRTIGQAQLQVQARHGAQAGWSAFERAAGEAFTTSGPFVAQHPTSQSLVGDRRSASFACGERSCALAIETARTGAEARLSDGRGERTFILRGARAAELRYLAADGTTGTEWPPAEAAATRLAAVALFDHGAPRAVMRVGVEQSARCVFEARGCGAAAGEPAHD